MSQVDFEKHASTGIEEYVLRARQSIPGRDAIFLIARALFEIKLAENAKILVVGAGGGEEILSLGLPNPGWQFVGVDLTKAMLELAETRFAQKQLPNKVELHQTDIRNLDETDFDAATCILTLAFVADDGAKLAMLRAIRERLKSGALFLLVEGVLEKEDAQFQENVRAWKRHAQNNGMPIELTEIMVENTLKLPLVTEERELELLREAGFADARKVFQGIHVNGWLSMCK